MGSLNDYIYSYQSFDGKRRQSQHNQNEPCFERQYLIQDHGDGIFVVCGDRTRVHYLQDKRSLRKGKADGKQLGQPKIRTSKSKLDGKEDYIRKLIKKKVSVYW